MKNFIEILEKEYQEENEYNECLGSRLDFIGETIFNFTMYDGDASERFALKMIEVIECIINRTTFEYQKENYDNYLTMVNMPFLVDKLDWGGSIRGAWLDYSKEYTVSYDIKIEKEEIELFLTQLIKWYYENEK
ncbi:MAG: hypothetical protein WBO70_04495 [Erysipelotrichaceae bacterium]